MMQVPSVILNDGRKMPALGLGTNERKPNYIEAGFAVKQAIDCGYRHFDTAYAYQSEVDVGKAIRDKISEGVITRDDVFIVTKLWNTFHDKDKVEYACKLSLRNLGLDYIDLYLIHLPIGFMYVDDKTTFPKDCDGKFMLSNVDYLETYNAMEKLVKSGLVKSIGLSNFNSKQIERILNNCEIKPVANQVECHPAFNQKKLIKFCRDRDIIITAYCPLGRPDATNKQPEFLYSEKIKAIAAQCNKTPAQVILRYLIDIGTVPIPKS